MAVWCATWPVAQDVGVNEVADALRAIRSAWDTATRDGGEACGMDVAERAYRDMQAAWFEELGVRIAVLGHADGQ